MYSQKGLAEIVNEPSDITQNYLDKWFRGDSSFGKALDILGIPHKKSNKSLFVYKNKEIFVDLAVEQEIIYDQTLLKYKKIENDFELKFDYSQIFNPIKIIGTLKLTYSQTKLLINYQKTYDFAKNLVENISLEIPENKKDLEDKLKNNVWPNLIAVDYIGEFIFASLTHNLNNEQKSKLLLKLHNKIGPLDWYTQSILAWEDYKDGKIEKKKFINNYGISASNAYELTQKRFYEKAKAAKPNLEIIKLKNLEIKNIEDLYVGMQYLRSEAKHKSLFWIDGLRNQLI